MAQSPNVSLENVLMDGPFAQALHQNILLLHNRTLQAELVKTLSCMKTNVCFWFRLDHKTPDNVHGPKACSAPGSGATTSLCQD